MQWNDYFNVAVSAAKMANSQSQHIQFENWKPQEVANWLQGLDESVAQYVPLFKAYEIDGRKLLMLNHSDLEKIGICKLGHQELVLEAVDLLRSLRYTLDTENLQSLALQLGCKARNLIAEISMRQGENDQNRANIREQQRKRLSITVLSYMADLLATLKNLVSWLDRAPFEGIYDICRLRNSVVKTGLEVVQVTQRESSYVNPEDCIVKSCRSLIEVSDQLVRNTKDPLVIQPAALELATIRKKPGEELGMNIQSAYNGVHGISSIKDLSPADMCSKIEKGDEVLQVNGQTVLGWQLKELVRILKEKPKEVSLLLKKRPRHINPLGAMQNHKKLAAKHAQQAATLPKPLKKRRSRDGEGKPGTRPLLQEFVTSLSTSAAASDVDVFVKDTAVPVAGGDGNDTDGDVFRSGSESPQYTLPVMPDAKQRRATVSGGSPTFERNSLMVEDPVIRPKSQAINQAERDAALAILAASENSLKSRAATMTAVAPPTAVEVKVGTGTDGGTTGPLSPVLRKTSSESSSGQKGPSESELEDSVFSSDKEDKDPQSGKRLLGAEAKRQEFRGAKPNPKLLDPGSASLVQSPASPTGHHTSSSSSISSTTSSSTLVTSHSPSPQAKHGEDGERGVPLAVEPLSSLGQTPAVARTLSSQAQGRPPSPVSAPPKRKKASSITRDGSLGGPGEGAGRQKGEKPAVPEKSESAKHRASIKRESMKAAKSLSVKSEDQISVHVPEAVAKAPGQQRKEKPTSPPPSSPGAYMVTKTQPGAKEFSYSTKSTEKQRIQVLEAHRDSLDNRPATLQQAIYTEVAREEQNKDTPQLMKIKRIESPKASDPPSNFPVEEPGTSKHKKKVEFSVDVKQPSPPQEVSYTHIVVGGVVQKIPIDKTHSGVLDSPPVRLRQKPGSRRLDRRVSCKDLGKGDCEGWLYKRKEKDSVLSKQWSKRWCVLKNSNLYYYKHQDDLKAEGVIYLPAFQVSPAPSLKTKKFAFKVHNSGTTFYFASERQEDMSKWMNKMGLAAINFDTSEIITTGGFVKPEPQSDRFGVQNIYYSESEDEGDDSIHGSLLSLNSLSSVSLASARSHPSPPTSAAAANLAPSAHSASRRLGGPPGPPGNAPRLVHPEHNGGSTEVNMRHKGDNPHSILLREINSRELTFDGVDRRQRRTQILSASLDRTETNSRCNRVRRLAALKRTLKMKEREVEDIDRVLASHISKSRLKDLLAEYPDLKM